MTHEETRKEYWRQVHLAGDRREPFVPRFEVPDRPFWKPEHELKAPKRKRFWQR